MSFHRLVITVGAGIGLIGFLIYFMIHFRVRRISPFEADELKSSWFLNLFSSLMIVKYWKLRKEVRSTGVQNPEILSDMKTLRVGLISIVILIFGFALQVMGMLGKARKLG